MGLPSQYLMVFRQRLPRWDTVYNACVEFLHGLIQGKADANHTHGAGGVVVTICTSTTRPASPTLGMLISETDTGYERRCAGTSPVTWSSPAASRTEALYQRRRVPVWQMDSQAPAAALTGDLNPAGKSVLQLSAATLSWAWFEHDVVVAGAAHNIIVQLMMSTAAAQTCNLGLGYLVQPATGSVLTLPRLRWAAGTAYNLHDYRLPSIPNGCYYDATVAGTSHATTEPIWPTTPGNTVVDNGVTWTCRSGGLKPLGIAATAVPATAYQGFEVAYNIPSGDCVAGGKVLVGFFRKSNDSHGGNLLVMDALLQAVEV